jgi:hypothetical protein
MVDTPNRVTHVIIHEGNLWPSKQVTIPIDAVVEVDNGIRLNVTKKAV